MLIKLLLLLAIGLKQATAICFRNETSNVKRKVVGRPHAVDDYHCKIMCVEDSKCLTYIFPENECFLLGELAHDAYTTCIKQYYEWVKKTEDGNCTETIQEPQIDNEYESNPALAIVGGSVDVPTINKWTTCQASQAVLDTILPDKSHEVQADDDSSMLIWDGKLGSWVFIKKTVELDPTGQYDQTKNVTTYIRAAKCFTIFPQYFKDGTSCGLELPAMDVPAQYQGRYEVTGPAKRNTLEFTDLCPDQLFMYRLDTGKVYADAAIYSTVACVGGAWIVSSQDAGNGKIVNGTCVKLNDPMTTSGTTDTPTTTNNDPYLVVKAMAPKSMNCYDNTKMFGCSPNKNDSDGYQDMRVTLDNGHYYTAMWLKLQPDSHWTVEGSYDYSRIDIPISASIIQIECKFFGRTMKTSPIVAAFVIANGFFSGTGVTCPNGFASSDATKNGVQSMVEVEAFNTLAATDSGWYSTGVGPHKIGHILCK